MNKLLTVLLAGAMLSLGGVASADHHKGDSQSRDNQSQAQPESQSKDAGGSMDESTSRDPQAEANDPELFAKLKKCDESSLNDEELRQCIRKAKNKGNEM